MKRKKTIPMNLRREIIRRDNYACQYCGLMATRSVQRGTLDPHQIYAASPRWWEHGRISFEIDHVVPESKGGEATLDNLRLSCRACNRSKGSKRALV